MFDWLIDLATSTWAYVISALVIIVDALVGVLPSEAVLHAAGVGAARGDTSVILLIAIATIAAILADLLAYTIGAKWGTELRDWLIEREGFPSGKKTARRLDGVREQLDERTWLISVARFVPGLRTVTMYGAGTLGFPRGRFLAYEAPGALAWASYNVLIGYVFGRLFRDASFWVPFAVSLAIAGALSLVFEVLRRTKLKVEEAAG